MILGLCYIYHSMWRYGFLINNRSRASSPLLRVNSDGAVSQLGRKKYQKTCMFRDLDRVLANLRLAQWCLPFPTIVLSKRAPPTMFSHFLSTGSPQWSLTLLLSLFENMALTVAVCHCLASLSLTVWLLQWSFCHFPAVVFNVIVTKLLHFNSKLDHLS